MKRGERGPEKEGRKTTSPLATTSSPPRLAPLTQIQLSHCVFLTLRNTSEKHTREKPPTQANAHHFDQGESWFSLSLTIITSYFLSFFLKQRKTFFVCFSSFFISLTHFKAVFNFIYGDKSCTAIPQANDASDLVFGRRATPSIVILTCDRFLCIPFMSFCISLSNLSALPPVDIITSTQHQAGSLCQSAARPHIKNVFARSKVHWLIVLPQRRQSQSTDFIRFVDCQAGAVIRVSFNRRQSPPFASVIENQIRSQAQG